MEKDKVSFYRDAKGEFRWRRRDEGNHKITGAATEGYTTYRAAYNNAYDQYGETVEYMRWSHADTGDPEVEVKLDDDRSTPEN